VDAEEIEKTGAKKILKNADGVLVPGGFGSRGIEGKILAAEYAREKPIPYFGICLGMQLAVAEFMRNVVGRSDANSTEFNPDTSCPVIDLLPEQVDIEQLGGTMRLGAYRCDITDGSLARKAYGKKSIDERHRHRYEFNNAYRDDVTGHGMVISGVNPQRNLVEIIEIPDHPWFLGCQFHPEFKSRPIDPHPLFVSFIEAALKK